MPGACWTLCLKMRVREEKNDIGGGFFMDDYVYRYALEEERA